MKGRRDVVRPCKWIEVTFVQVEGREGRPWLGQSVKGVDRLKKGHGIKSDELHRANRG